MAEKITYLKFLGKDGIMRIVKLSAFFLVCAGVVLMNGCSPGYDDLKIQNATQRKWIAELESEVQTTRLKLGQLKRELDTAEGRCGVELEALQQKIAALEEDYGKKKALIASMQQQLLYGGAQLPVELSTMLEDFAEGEEMVTYDTSRGIVKFQSVLLFERVRDYVERGAGK